MQTPQQFSNQTHKWPIPKDLPKKGLKSIKRMHGLIREASDALQQ